MNRLLIIRKQAEMNQARSLGIIDDSNDAMIFTTASMDVRRMSFCDAMTGLQNLEDRVDPLCKTQLMTRRVPCQK